MNLEQEHEDLKHKPKTYGLRAHTGLEVAKIAVQAILEPLKLAAEQESTSPSRLGVIESHMHLIRRAAEMSGYRNLPVDDVDASDLVLRWVKEWWPMRPGRPKKRR